MATRDNHTLILIQDSGSNIEVDATEDEVYFEEHGVLGGWQFHISKEDWEQLKKFVDARM